MPKTITLNLEARVSALELLVHKLLDSIAVGKVAEKTADKALAMAQEALAMLIMDKKSQEEQDPLDFAPPAPADVGLPVRERAVRGLSKYNAQKAEVALVEEPEDDPQQVSQDDIAALNSPIVE